MNHSTELYPMENSKSFNDTSTLQAEYNQALAYLQRRYPDHTPFLKNLNPYTGKVISSKRAFDEYLRQYALRLAYEKIFAESEYGRLYLAEKENFELQLATKESEIRRLEQASRSQMEQIERSSKRSRRLAGIVLVLVASLCFGYFKLLPNIKESSYNEGKTAGYESGEAAGYNQGYSKGESDGYSSGYRAGTQSGTTSIYIPNNLPSSHSGDHYISSVSSTVYVSRNGKIHKISNCSGMKYYTEMDYDAAIAAGYVLCSKCF